MNRNLNTQMGKSFGQKQFNPQFRQPPRPAPINRTFFPSRDFDPLIITQLLLKASTENNLLDLKKFIMENGITTNDMLNEDGQSILHLILLNINLSKRQKLEMFRFLRDNGTLVSSFDKLNQTPLHIACKLQLTDIVLELINAGHDINAIDASYKTPLHYAVIGNSIEIPDKVDKKIFPKTKLKIKSDIIPNLTQNLLEYIDTIPELKQFIVNQFNTFKNSDKLFREKIDEIMNSSGVLDKITTILVNPSLDDNSRKEKIFEITSEVNSKVKDYLNSQLNLSKKQLNLQPNTENGWGPSDLSGDLAVNKILEYAKYSDLETLIDSDKNILENIKTKKLETDNQLNDNLFNFLDEINKLKELNEELLFTNNFLKEISTIVDRRNIQMYTHINTIVFSDNDMKSNFGYNNTIDNKYYNGDLLSSNIIDLTQPANLKQINYNNFAIAYNSQNDYNIYSTNNPRQNQQKQQLRQLIANCFTDYDAFGNITNDINTIFGTPITYDIYYITNKLELSYNSINNIKQNLQNSIDKLIINIDKKDEVLSNLSDSIIYLLSFINELPKYFKEYSKVTKVFSNIKNLLDVKIKLDKDFTFANTHKANIFFEAINQDVNIALSFMKTTESTIPNIFFNLLKNYYDILTDCIKYTNTTSSKKYIKAYFNDFDEIQITTLKADPIADIFENNIEYLNPFFKSYEDIINFLNINDEQSDQQNNKRKLIENYLLQLSQKYNYTYITSNTIKNKVVPNSNVGFLIGSIKLASLDIDITKLNLKYGDNGIITSDGIIINDSSLTKEAVYSVKMVPFTTQDKSNSSLAIVSAFIDQFIYIQKYIITKFILNDIYIKLNTPSATPSELEKNIKKLNDEIEENIKNDPSDKSIIMITIAKIIDKILNTNLDNIITITTNDYAYRYVRGDLNTISNLNDFSMINITNFDKINLNDINIDDLNKDIYKLFKKHKKLELYKSAEDIMIKKPHNKKTYKLMSSTIGDNPAELNMEFDIELIKLILKNNANINAKDKDGNTPFSIAIMQSNNDLIKFLLNENYPISVNTHKSKNRFGFKPFDLSINGVLLTIENFNTETDKKSLEYIITETNDEIAKITRINHNMRYFDILIKMLLYLINHNFYSKLNNYYNTETKIDHDNIFNLLTTQITKLPLLTNSDDLFVSYHGYINNMLNDKNDEIVSKTNSLTQLRKQQINLEREKRDLDKINYPQKNTYRIKEINELKQKINNNKINYGDLKENNKEKIIIQNTLDQSIYTNTKKLNKLINYNFEIKANPIETYDNLSKKILELYPNKNDYRTYPTLWENLFKNNSSDETQIINKIFEKLKSDCNKIKQNPNDNNNIKLCNTSVLLLIKDIQNYFDLPSDYNDVNYTLNELLDIIKHIVKNIMITNLYHTIIKLLRAEIQLKIPRISTEDEVEYYKKIDDKITAIINTEVNKNNLLNYLFEILPEKIVKISLNIYEDENDDDKNTSIINLLLFIDKILIANTEFALTKENSKTLKMLSKDIYPYFKNNFEINIKRMKKIADGYFSMILNFSSKLEILEQILEKAKNETI